MLSVSTANVFPRNPKLAALIEEHNDLDEAVAVLLASAACDDLLVNRLKKRKLHLKDEIAVALSQAANTSEADLTG
ncbi:MAG TPA: YdcH family protein [Rhizomicrobium sp.]|nr:YdcH family protein [Rhizomicrobium sp.]